MSSLVRHAQHMRIINQFPPAATIALLVQPGVVAAGDHDTNFGSRSPLTALARRVELLLGLVNGRFPVARVSDETRAPFTLRRGCACILLPTSGEPALVFSLVNRSIGAKEVTSYGRVIEFAPLDILLNTPKLGITTGAVKAERSAPKQPETECAPVTKQEPEEPSIFVSTDDFHQGAGCRYEHFKANFASLRGSQSKRKRCFDPS